MGNMARKRHIRSTLVALMGLALVCPPLTGAIAAGFGLDLAHHHCDDHGIETLADHAKDAHDHAHEHDVDNLTDAHAHAGTGDHDPYQCDQCDIALVALPADAVIQPHTEVTLPAVQDVLRLRAADPPLAFKPPIA